MKSDDYKDLIVWQKSIDLVVEIYRLITKFPKAEMEFYRFLCYARGSLGEVDTQLIIAQKVNYLTQDELEKVNGLILEIKKMISALLKTLKTNK